jgi:hypothetical protein
MRGCVFVVAALFLVGLALTQATCPIPRCTGSDLDAWLLPAATAPVGIPALAWAAIFVVRRMRLPR